MDWLESRAEMTPIELGWNIIEKRVLLERWRDEIAWVEEWEVVPEETVAGYKRIKSSHSYISKIIYFLVGRPISSLA